jgi:hypothetical protein
MRTESAIRARLRKLENDYLEVDSAYENDMLLSQIRLLKWVIGKRV